MLHGPIIALRTVRLMSTIVITEKLRNYSKPIACHAPRADAAAIENHRAVKVTQACAAVSRRPRPDQCYFQPRRYLPSARYYRHAREYAFRLWAEYAHGVTT